MKVKSKFWGSVIAILIAAKVFLCCYVTDGESMMPTIHDGDLLIGTRIYKELCHGDIITAKQLSAKGEVIPVVKRVIALEGDTVEIINNTVKVNGVELTEDYILEPMDTPDISLVVDSDCIFVLGDNRNNSFDSRRAGVIKLSDVKSVVFFDLSNWRRM